MKKVRRTLALIGVALLVALYVSTLVFAITDHTETMGFFKASVAATILVPVLLWAYTLIYKLAKPSEDTEEESSKED